MKYTIKFTNGYWKVFDNVKYEDVLLCNLKTEAEFHCKRLNGKGQ